MQIIKSNELVDYTSALEFMEHRVDEVINGTGEECLWLLEHPPLYTKGTSAKDTDLLSNKFPVYDAGRGGEFTYHGPGQQVVYLVKKIEPKDLRLFVWKLEEWVINLLARVGISGERRNGRIGIWVVANGVEEKIAAIGIRVRKWVAYHGIAVNINPDLSHFDGIVPCGISEFGVTSTEKLGVKIDRQELDQIFVQELLKIFPSSTTARL